MKHKISHSQPPNYQKILLKFNISLEDGLIVAYEDTIYHSRKFVLSNDQTTHELTHLHQQKELGVVSWWDKYLEDPEFRASQEIEAYQAQYKYLETVIKDKNELKRRLYKLASLLSSPLYGNIMNQTKAKRAISQRTDPIF